MNASTSCPTCGSPAPERHPAVQHEGEVQPCRDPFHLTVTPQNTPERIAEAQALIEKVAPPSEDSALARILVVADPDKTSFAEEAERLAAVRDLAAQALAAEDRYKRGFLDGLAAYAYSSGEAWAENGVQYVGTTGRTLAEAKARVRETWNYAP